MLLYGIKNIRHMEVHSIDDPKLRRNLPCDRRVTLVQWSTDLMIRAVFSALPVQTVWAIGRGGQGRWDLRGEW